MQRRSAVVGSRLEAGLVGQQQFGDVPVPLVGCDVQRGGAVVGAGVNVRSVSQQDLRDILMTVPGGVPQ